jgi:hypothetical protein
VVDQRHGNEHPLPHTAGKFVGVEPQFGVDVWDSHRLENVHDFLALGALREAPMCANGVAQLRTHGQDGI